MPEIDSKIVGYLRLKSESENVETDVQFQDIAESVSLLIVGHLELLLSDCET